MAEINAKYRINEPVIVVENILTGVQINWKIIKSIIKPADNIMYGIAWSDFYFIDENMLFKNTEEAFIKVKELLDEQREILLE